MSRRASPLAVLAILLSSCATAPAPAPLATVPTPLFTDATLASGLPLMNSARLTFTDLNGDGRPDIVARVGDRYRVFLNLPANNALGFRYVEVEHPGLPSPQGGDLIVFADLDNDGKTDAVFTRNLDTKNPTFKPPKLGSTTQPSGTCWLKGNGDGTFGPPQLIPAATPATTICIAIGDANGDGLPDIFIGNAYDHYGTTYTAYPSDLLIQHRDASGHISFERAPLPEDSHPFDEDHDLGPRPIYGAMFVRLDESPLPSLLQIAYGRRWNRLYVPTGPFAATGSGAPAYEDRAPQYHIDGDDDRSGKYPDWLKELAKTDKRFNSEDEKPFRSNGNGFDAAVGDVDGDGKFDLFLANITHAWAGPSSDRSRFLLQRTRDGHPYFEYDPRLSVDRPGTTHDASTTRPNWNQGDLFARLADIDQDGHLDLVLASSDYPDLPPHENRLRIYLQQPDGSFKDTPVGIDQIGAQQISLADINGDGTLDLLVGQSFNRFTPKMIAARTPPGPTARLFLNHATGHALTLRLIGDPAQRVPRDAFNTIVKVTATIHGQRTTQLRQLLGPGGHNSKGADLAIHIGLADATYAEKVEILWPAPGVPPTVLEYLPAGTHVIYQSRQP